MTRNQTKIFVAVVSDPEGDLVLGADLTLEEAQSRFQRVVRGSCEWHVVYEMPLGCPQNRPFDDKHGYVSHTVTVAAE